jgi:hypothetical protein
MRRDERLGLTTPYVPWLTLPRRRGSCQVLNECLSARPARRFTTRIGGLDRRDAPTAVISYQAVYEMPPLYDSGRRGPGWPGSLAEVGWPERRFEPDGEMSWWWTPSRPRRRSASAGWWRALRVARTGCRPVGGRIPRPDPPCSRRIGRPEGRQPAKARASRPIRERRCFAPLESARVGARLAGQRHVVAAQAARRPKGGPMGSSSAPLPTPDGPGSVSGAPNLPAGFTDTFTAGRRTGTRGAW